MSLSVRPLIIFGEELQDSSRSEVGPVLPDSKRGGAHPDYAPRAAYGSTDGGFAWSDIPYLPPFIIITFASHHGGRRSTLVVLASIAQRFCAPTTIPRRRPGALHTCLSPGATACRCEGGRTLGVPAVDLRVRWGHQRSVTVTMSTLTEGAIRRVASMDLRRGF